MELSISFNTLSPDLHEVSIGDDYVGLLDLSDRYRPQLVIEDPSSRQLLLNLVQEAIQQKFRVTPKLAYREDYR